MTEKTIDKLYYTIGEVARYCDISPSMVRNWCREYGIKPIRKSGGVRKFTRSQTEELRMIADMQKIRRADAIKVLLYQRYPRTFARFKDSLVLV